MKKLSFERIRLIARNSNIDLQSIGVYSKSDLQHHIRTLQFQELLKKWVQNEYNQLAEVYENSLKLQASEIFTNKTIMETLKTLKTPYVSLEKNTDLKMFHQLIFLVL